MEERRLAIKSVSNRIGQPTPGPVVSPLLLLLQCQLMQPLLLLTFNVSNVKLPIDSSLIRSIILDVLTSSCLVI